MGLCVYIMYGEASVHVCMHACIYGGQRAAAFHWLDRTGWLIREPEGGVFMLRGELPVPAPVLSRSTVTDVNATMPGFHGCWASEPSGPYALRQALNQLR